MQKIDIKVPNIGEFKDVEIIEVIVQKGQDIKKDDPLITIESDKSSVEIPSTENGKIIKLGVKVGDKVSEGDKILELEVNEELNIKKTFSSLSEQNITSKIQNNFEKLEKKNDNLENVIKKDFSLSTLASPKARKFARELNVDINKVIGSERKGRVTENDIKFFVSNKFNENFKAKKKIDNKMIQEYSHEDFGKIETKDIPRVKKLSSKYLINSWSNIPHVTNHDEADITEMEEFRNTLTDIYTGEKKKITPLAFIIKAVTASLRKFPNFNTSLDDIENGKMIIKKYYHIGIAVDTPNGLMVPKLRNANNKNITLIAEELKNLSEQCRNLKIDKKELFGGSITITSLGGIGGSHFTPIINSPEVAILGVGKSQKKLMYFEGTFQTRIMLPISLSYDHRIIDGAEAARFNNDLKENLGKNFAYKLAV
ncbi:2-oxo acid dehydrogenase subunit E2 [Pelagibacterales bacterium SAG-MED13]|nr:2-oxo acid dehydrogenase subunit E2 [Pelagibacterales bacterium SAG-MED13]